MPDAQRFALTLTPERLADFCRQVRQRAREPAPALQQLTAVQALLGIGADNPDNPAYRQARALLDEQVEALRGQLLAQHAAQLGTALRDEDGAGIARSFQALSRSGFAIAACRAWQQLTPAQRQRCAAWLEDWYQDSVQRATAASRYPDVPDLAAAGVNLETWLALQELQRMVMSFET